MEIWVCEICKNEYIRKTSTQTICSKTCKKLSWPLKMKLKSEKWEEFKKEQSKKSKKEFGITDTIKRAIIYDMREEKWVAFCNECGDMRVWLDLHHLAMRSEVPNHPKKHSKINSILLCNEFSPNKCHSSYHKNKSLRDKWVVKRCLYDVFPELFKKDNYI